MDMISFITSKDGFLHALPMLIAGLFAFGIIIERMRALYRVYPIHNEAGFFERIRDLVMKGNIAEAIALCDRVIEKPVAQVVKKGLLRAHQPESLIENGLEIAVEEATYPIKQRTQHLAMIANVATLLGLLGTIAGLITSFKSISGPAAEGGSNTELLAQGIATAMNATMLGLSVAIPAMVAFSFLMNKSNRIMSDTETAAVRILDIIKQRYFEAEARALGTGTHGPSPGHDGGHGVA